MYTILRHNIQTDAIGEGVSRIKIPSVSGILAGLGRVLQIPQSHSVHFKFLADVIQFRLESRLVLQKPLHLKTLICQVPNVVRRIFFLMFPSTKIKCQKRNTIKRY